MSRSVELPEAVYAALEEAAAADATSPAEWIAARVPQPAPAVQPESEGLPLPILAERLTAHVDGIRMERSDSFQHCEGSGPSVHQRMIQVSEDVYRDLELEALALGTTPAEWIAARLPDRSPATTLDEGAQSPRTPADEFAGYIGLFSSGRGDLSERVSELFAEGMVEKHRARQP
jgi:hypothetical protein